ncbi:MAG TPA: winged helix-turn-helix domain-containing protein [Gammaproteobacteria bacterium]|nr:winged helix-turn-helix domain-containing protein [Gammaproteobacteria bacterium]
MAPDSTLLFLSGDLTICPERGEVRNARGESARLGPVNMKVLMLLLSRPGQVVSRGELFEGVWRNQVVSDDSLTRCISDIRAQLSELSDRDGYIETLPKRGYRWIADVRKGSSPVNPAAASANPPVEQSAREDPTLARSRPRAFPRRALVAWAGRGLAYLSALVLIATLGVWLMDHFARPGLPVIAVLPTRADQAQLDLAASVEEQLAEHLIRLEQVDLLSRSAVESRPNNPFPYFYYEFGARWLIESELRSLSGQTVLTVVLVDARTGIVLFQSTEPITDGARPAVSKFERVFRPLEDFIEAQFGP